MMTEFLVEVVENIVVIHIQLERATLSKAGFFRDTITELIQTGTREIIVDCRTIDFMDSTFLGALVVSLKKIKSLDGDLRLVFSNQTSAVWSMFEATRMFKVIKSYFSLEEAIKSYKTPIE